LWRAYLGDDGLKTSNFIKKRGSRPPILTKSGVIEREIWLILSKDDWKSSEFHQIIMKNDSFFRFFGAKDTGKRRPFWLKWVKIGRLKRFI